ncbi:protein Wnt-6-like [Lutzomyia longipalpis]|nr:protein Wnt-6-like [Lutzomyia longipalpis]XP_055680770.1 protein Wnt-6-like [Lutzomyia longipalpis]XP_055680771.1 protein Wnt-6-like [Lutzomyia longipalpis]
MRFVLISTLFLLLMPITGSGWVEGSNVLLDPQRECRKSKRARGKLTDICKNGTSLLKEITNGISMSFAECQYQFRNNRWNCNTQRRSLKRILARDTRETAFVNAITAAGIAYTVARACATGNLVECTCHANSQSHPPSKLKKWRKYLMAPDESWEWAGCGDNINFGVNKSKIFLDARYRRKKDIKALVKTHNNIAGLLAIKKHMQLKCRCHGMSGSCTMQTCWMVMPPFREVADRLRERYDGAAKVIARNDGTSLMPEGRTIKPPTKEDLVYAEESPDFCRPNHRTGSLGTQGRECNATSMGMDGCELLCCNRGYRADLVTRKVPCHCTFEWCCEVKCKMCDERKTRFTCL